MEDEIWSNDVILEVDIRSLLVDIDVRKPLFEVPCQLYVPLVHYVQYHMILCEKLSRRAKMGFAFYCIVFLKNT